MSNIMQYMINQTDEFRDAYADNQETNSNIQTTLEDILEQLAVVNFKLQSIEKQIAHKNS